MQRDQAEWDQQRKGLGIRLKAARTNAEMTQEQAATALGLKKAAVSNWEIGKNVPDSLTLRRLAKLYKVTADALLWDDALTIKAIQFAVEYDALSDQQRKVFEVMWKAYFAQASTDQEVEAAFKNAPKAAPQPSPERR